MKTITLLILGLAALGLTTLGLASPAAAWPICRTVATHEICILDLRRSAKNYWEYRAVVAVDGIQRPLEIYSCREQIRIKSSGEAVPFQPDGAGVVICKLFKAA